LDVFEQINIKLIALPRIIYVRPLGVTCGDIHRGVMTFVEE